MPVKKTVAKKTTVPAKKTVAKKTAAAKTPVDNDDSAAKGMAEKIMAAIKDGHFDPYLNDMDTALNERINRHVAEKRAAAVAAKKTESASAPAEKKVAAPPKKTKLVSPVSGKNYKVAERLKSLGGATVKFMHFKVDSDEAKSVVEMVTDKPGSPKGKRMVIPTSSLEEAPQSKKPVKKSK